MIETKGILHFSLPVTDLERSKTFFMELLGCELVTESPIMVFLKTGDDHFILFKSMTPIDPNVPGDVRVHHAFMVDHDKYDAAMAAVKDHGVHIIRDEYRDTQENQEDCAQADSQGPREGRRRKRYRKASNTGRAPGPPGHRCPWRRRQAHKKANLYRSARPPRRRDK